VIIVTFNERALIERWRTLDGVERGEIETVLSVFPDMYGRLMGKRIFAGFFLE